jgi:hypothetical protein
MRWVILLLVLLVPRPALSQSRNAVAQHHYAEGREAFKAGEFDKARAAFEASLKAFDSPNARLYLARSLVELGELGPAALQYQLARGVAKELSRNSPRYLETAEAAERELQALLSRIGHVRLTVPQEPLNVQISGSELTEAVNGVAYPVTPGNVNVQVSGAGYLPWRRNIRVRAGQTVRVEVRLEPKPSSSKPAGPGPGKSGWPTLAWVGFGVGAAGTAGFATFAILAQNTHDDLESRCQSGDCGAVDQSDVDRGRTYQLLTNVSLGVAAAGFLTGAAALWLDDTADSGMAVGLSPAGVTVRGTL